MCFIGLCWGQLVLGQQSQPVANNIIEANQWYQVEVLIFANDDPAAASEEHWRNNLGLKYPQPIIHLSEANDDLQSTAAPDSNQPDGLSTSFGLSTGTAMTAEQQPFTVLPKDQLQLTDIAKRLLRQRYLRILFHKAWRQPIADRDQSNSILVRGGDPYDDHYELEGSIKLSVERYLHIETDLWLSTFVSAAGLEDTLWPVLPRLPVTSTAQPAVRASIAQSDFSLLASINADSPFLNLHRRQYEVDRTVALRQSRRMRSNELHYIDHPLMGLLVKVSPYEPEPAPEQSTQPAQPTSDNSPTSIDTAVMTPSQSR